MSIAAASAQLLLEVDGAEWARAGALAPRYGGRGRALHPPPPPAYQLRARPAWVREGGCDGLGLGMASVCI
jgi:hypothetical protein